MKDKIIKMGGSEIILKYDEKTKLINVIGDLGDVCGVVGCNVSDVGGNVGKVGGKIGSVIEE